MTFSENAGARPNSEQKPTSCPCCGCPNNGGVQSQWVLQDEPYVTIKHAAQITGLPEWKIARAVNQGSIAHFTFANGRKLVRISDIEAAIVASQVGGAS